MFTTHSSFKNKRKKAINQNRELLEKLMEEFCELYPDDTAALRAIYERLGEEIFHCRHCEDDLPKDYTVRSIKCGLCSKLNWLTSGTSLHGMRKPRAAFAAIWLCERGVVLTSPQFSDAFEISRSTGTNLIKKISYAMLETLDDQFSNVPTAALLEVYSRRSDDTPRRSHPSSEQQEMEQEASFEQTSADNDKDWIIEVLPGDVPADREQVAIALLTTSEDNNISAVQAEAPPETPETIDGESCDSQIEKASPLREIENRLLEHIGDEPVALESLICATSIEIGRLSSALTMLELDGLVKQLDGLRFIRCGKTPAIVMSLVADLQAIICEFKEHIKFFCGGISRKAVQLYLISFWYHKYRTLLPQHWLSNTFLGFGYIKDKQIRDYVSPLLIKFPVCPASA